MACTDQCVRPSPTQAHCGGSGCHVTFGGVRGFDKHRKDGRCRTPESLGMTVDGRGVWRRPQNRAGWWEQRRRAALPLPQNVIDGLGDSPGTHH